LNGNSFRTLEFESIRALLLSHAGSASGRERVERLAPLTEADAVRRALGRTTEATALLQAVGRQPYHDLPDVAELLPESRVAGHHLEPRALTDIASFAEGAREIGWRVARAEGAPALARRASEIADATDVAAAIRRAILPSGEVADDASPKLADIRRSLVRMRSQLTSVMEGYLKGKDAERILQDRIVTTRNDRYVLLLKAEFRGQVPGIIHGSSGSGASLFVEPMPAVELNNDIVSLGDEERAEVLRILRELTSRVGERADDLARSVDILGELDALQAMALAARDMNALAPEIVEDRAGRLELLDARHPLLIPAVVERLGIPRRTSREPVPVTLRLTDGATVLVISGPNTGGKTVALKTVGLLSLMAQCGLHVPAAPGSALPVFRRVFADIGDDQSIAANLSTFSAHLANIVSMTKDLARPALVLLDEVGAGTDPTEGGALGVAIVDHFRAKGAMVLATTHHGLMKAYAQATPGVTAASFGYNPATYEPTYQLALGSAGRSLALEMAERLGLPHEVVESARTRVSDKEAQAEALLKKLEEDRAAVAHLEARVEARRAEVHEGEVRLRRAEAEIEGKKRAELAAFTKELRRRGEDAARRAAEAVQKAVEKIESRPRISPAAVAKAKGEAVADIRAAEAEALAVPGMAVEAGPADTGAPVTVGARVRARTLGFTGEVMALSGDIAEIAVSGKRVRVPRADLVTVAGGGAGARSRGGVAVAVAERAPSGTAHGAAEVNLVGLRVDEALPKLDKTLDEAALGDKKEVRVIHGFGEGKLRRAVAEFLEGHPHVAQVRLGAESRGGVTVVELKE
jgi:DNA mismatch repair protein MutS2